MQSKHNSKVRHQITRENKRGREEKTFKNKSETTMAIRIYISVITLNVSGLNAPTKRDRLAQWIQKQVKVKSLSRVRFFATGWIGSSDHGIFQARVLEWIAISFQDLCKCYLWETHFRSRDTYRLKMRGWKKVFHANENQS